ncbi:PTS transporter subunit EIIC [Pengzhenrongella sp.]|uniref:PTS transporter subunit EIIC n=1 Tax=Pengzhenrongella sp. TaxID=2888820 RepID=UPI002F92D79D
MTATTAPEIREKRPLPGFAQLQRIGRSLMLPIASLPAAGLLLRLGQPDMLGATGIAGHLSGTAASALITVAAVLAGAGNALFANLPMIFALGVAVGYARKSDGSTGLAALVGYLVFKGVTDALSPNVLGKAGTGETQELINYGVLGGIVIGLIAALLFQKYSRIKLPAYLAFFGGRRFVPIATAGMAIVVAVIGALLYKYFNQGLHGVANFVAGSSILGGFVYGTANRLLVPIGLHHLLNSPLWFQIGEYTDASGQVWQGDIARFLHHDPTAGTFMTGFFPIMMFALPGAALAFVHTAKPAKRKVIAGIMGSAALVSFVTGVTEPLEFSFVYVAYPLYAIHAVLTGTSLAIVNALGIHDGFSFSAGAIDYALNFRIATHPVWLLGIGLIYGVVYYFLFRFVITKWNLRTPGREDDDAITDPNNALIDQPTDAAPATRAANAGPANAGPAPAGPATSPSTT